jgi:hypothetical protein
MKFDFDRGASTNEIKAAVSSELLRYLDRNHIKYSTVTETGGNAPSADPQVSHKRGQLRAVKRCFYHDWRRIELKLRTSIAEGISVFLSVSTTTCPSRRRSARPKNATAPISIPRPIRSSDAAVFAIAGTGQSVRP